MSTPFGPTDPFAGLCGEGPDVGRLPCIRERGHDGLHLEAPHEPTEAERAHKGCTHPADEPCFGPRKRPVQPYTGIHSPGGPAL